MANSEKLADQWSPDAVYINRSTGEEVVGRKAIAEQFDSLFEAQKDLKLDVSIESIRLLSPNVAVEQGTATFLLPKPIRKKSPIPPCMSSAMASGCSTA